MDAHTQMYAGVQRRVCVCECREVQSEVAEGMASGQLRLRQRAAEHGANLRGADHASADGCSRPQEHIQKSTQTAQMRINVI